MSQRLRTADANRACGELKIAHGLNGRTPKFLTSKKITGELAVTLVSDIGAILEVPEAMGSQDGAH